MDTEIPMNTKEAKIEEYVLIEDLVDRLERADDELIQLRNMAILNISLKHIFPEPKEWLRLIKLNGDSITSIEQDIKSVLYHKYVEAKKLVSFIETNVFENDLGRFIMRKEHEEQFNREYPD